MRVTVLGCGGSGGVPVVGNYWGDCDPSEPKNRRRRVSILVEQDDTRILVDTSPDLREQLLAAKVDRLTAVVYTHSHADHVHGIDDLRALNYRMKAALPAYARPETLAEIERRFGYVFQPLPGGNDPYIYRPALTPMPVDQPRFEIGGIPVTWFEQDHGFGGVSTGYRFADAAYSTDVWGLSEDALAKLAGLKLWVVDCLRWEAHPSHAHFDRVLDWVARLKPRRTVLTHMNHAMDYRKALAKCPPGVEPGYDGLVVEV
ncbi:MAG: MBL fold metallo-hydrolase [Rhodospirillales bacterium]